MARMMGWCTGCNKYKMIRANAAAQAKAQETKKPVQGLCSRCEEKE